jgi:hypothetical protein
MDVNGVFSRKSSINEEQLFILFAVHSHQGTRVRSTQLNKTIVRSCLTLYIKWSGVHQHGPLPIDPIWSKPAHHLLKVSKLPLKAWTSSSSSRQLAAVQITFSHILMFILHVHSDIWQRCGGHRSFYHILGFPTNSATWVAPSAGPLRWVDARGSRPSGHGPPQMDG